MPGLSLVYGTNLLNKSVSSLKHHSNISIKKEIIDEKFYIIKSGFDGYPFFNFTTDAFNISLEGFVYNLSTEEIMNQLLDIGLSYLNKLDYKNKIRQFMLASDGEYIVFIRFTEKGSFLVFNDQWGRLPFFWFNENKVSILSRELKFILPYLPKIQFNKIALLEYLVLKYPLGDGTIFESVFRLLPGHLIVCEKNRFFCEEVVSLNFDFNPLSKETQTIKFYAEKAKKILFESLTNRLEKMTGYTIAIDISGGYDSRAVLSATSQLTKDFIPITIDLITGNEISIAVQVVETLKLNVLSIKPKRDFSPEAMREILFKTDGFIDGWLATACYQDAEEIDKNLKPPIAEFGGFGGGLLRHPLKPKRYYKNAVDIINDNADSNTLIKNSCKCLKLARNELNNYWSKFFSENYHEKEITDIVTHYYFDYDHLYVGAGEDRRRIHFWPVHPMLSSQWLYFSTKQVPKQILNFELFQELLFVIDPKIAITKIPIWTKNSKKLNIRIPKAIATRKMYRKLMRFYIKTIMKRAMRSDSNTKRIIDEIKMLYQETPTIRRYFDQEAVKQFIRTELLSLKQLHSIFMYINKIESLFPEKFIKYSDSIHQTNR